MTAAAPDLLDTPRLLLRRPVAADAPAIFSRYASDPVVTRYMSFRRHHSVADTGAFIASSDREWTARGCGPYLVLERADDRLLGGTGLSIAGDEAETGYLLAADAWGQGFATEALAAMVALARALDLVRLRAHCHPDNRASVRVLEKCGFALARREPQVHVYPNLGPDPQDVLVFERVVSR